MIHHHAAFFSHLDVYKLMLEKCKDPNPGDNSGATPIHYAASKGHLVVCWFMMKKLKDKNPKNESMESLDFQAGMAFCEKVEESELPAGFSVIEKKV